MKKILVVALMSVVMLQAKMFVGFDGGYMLNGWAGNGMVDSTVYTADKHTDRWSVGMNFGVEGMVNNYFGARALLDATYSRGLGGVNLNGFDIGGGLDVLVNFVPNFGIFGGIGVAYASTFDDSLENGRGSLPIFGRVGMSINFAGNSRIDFTAKLPMVGWKLHGTGVGTDAKLGLEVGYKYLF